jgi:hypothetical protein
LFKNQNHGDPSFSLRLSGHDFAKMVALATLIQKNLAINEVENE